MLVRYLIREISAIYLYLPSYHTDNGDWEPRLYEYQQRGANVLFFTFINPETMRVAEAFKKLGRVQSL